jgi:iron(III) transport system substrate-binding protein
MKKLDRVVLGSVLITMLIGLMGCTSAPAGGLESGRGQVINVYTTRHYTADRLLFEEFTKQTGIRVNEVKGTGEELINRLKREGSMSEADLFFAVDGGVLNYAKQAEVLQPLSSTLVERNVPVGLRDADQQWIGITTRARVIVYAKDRINPVELSTYEDLASEKWKGKLLVRSSSSPYNQSLLASFIELMGEEEAEKWTRGITRNLARMPEGGDIAQAKAIANKVGDVAIMNAYYIGQMSASADAEDVKIARSLGMFFPNQGTTGTHLNISGIGMAKYTKNKELAVKLVEFMTSPAGQTLLANESYEFPVNPEADMPSLLKSWGSFKSQHIDFAKLSDHNALAIELFNKAGWK